MNGGSLMAQVLKEEVRQKILETSLNDFIKKGYLNTSMKEIAKGSGIAVGNVYNYFKDKEKLYDTLVMPVYSAINEIFNTPPEAIGLPGIEKKLMQFIEIYKKNKNIFIMLIDNSGNTKFEKMKETIIENFSIAVNRWKNILNQDSKNKDMFVTAFSSAYINGVISILSEKNDEVVKLKILYEYMTFMKDAIYKKYTKEVVV